tara:strand:- start:754 stop:984 length:231 start_codon:yes stop_codon:yes gene_type:complete
MSESRINLIHKLHKNLLHQTVSRQDLGLILKVRQQVQTSSNEMAISEIGSNLRLLLLVIGCLGALFVNLAQTGIVV